MHRTVSVALSLAVVSCSGMSKETSSTGAAAASGGMQMQAKLDSTGEVPPPTVGSSSPTGMATFTMQGDKMTYKVTASGLTSPVTVAHIHAGGPGVAGPVIAPLTIAPGSDPATAAGEGSIDASAIKGKKEDGSQMTMSDLMTAIKSGNAYVNVHTQNNPKGEVRGQITAASTP